jgi:hypothetical protein
MLKIKDKTGKLVATLKDEDSAPELVSEPAKELEIEEESEEGKEEDTDGDA